MGDQPTPLEDRQLFAYFPNRMITGIEVNLVSTSYE